MSEPCRLAMNGIRKRFGSTQALRGVDLELRPGEVHALVGENGAGKSTLMKVLSGAVAPDAGTMTLDGQPYAPAGPQEARRRGVAMIYQELTLAPHLSVEDNVMLGLEQSRWGFLRRAEQRRRVVEALAVLEHPEIRPESPVAGLSPAAQQLVEIARALILDVRVLVLDEPTSSLTRADAQRLFALMRRLRERGVALVYISHFLEEVQEIADRFTVLRDGQSVGGGLVRDFAPEKIIELMVGRSLTEQFPRVPHEIGERILDVNELQGVQLPRGVSFKLHRGEILGIAGIVGAGRTELLRAIFGLDQVFRGKIAVCTNPNRIRISDFGPPGFNSDVYFTTTASGGREHAVSALKRPTPQDRIHEGLGLLSEDRKTEGLALSQSIEDNLTYTRLRPYSFFSLLNLSRRRAAVADWLQKLNVRCAGPEQAVGELSGGNQQKVALGRLLHQKADILLLDEPTRGVDIGSKAEIYRLIGELAAEGKAVLFVSSYLPELLGVCDRLAVMARGKLSEVRGVSEWTAEQVMSFATGSG